MPNVKQTKKLSKQPVTTMVANNEMLVKVNSSNKITLITLASLKAALLDGRSLNALEDGVLIMCHRKSDNYPVVYKPHKWTAQQNAGEVADGVVVVEGGKLLVVAPTEAASALSWGSAKVAGGGVSTSDRVTAYSDMAGKSNTAAQITHSELSGANYAPGFCAQYSRTNANGNGLTAGKWWLPAMGEMMMVYANMTKINFALSLIEDATQLQETAYWTSTEHSATIAWGLYLSNGYMFGNAKAPYASRVRPVSAFIL